jgi:hypothetical protein
MRSINTKKAAAVIGAGAIAVAGSGVAFAYWTTTGSGTSSAIDNGTANGTVTLTATFPTGIVPGESKTVTFYGANPGTTDLRVGTVHLDSVTIVKATNNTGACVAGDFTMANVDENQTVPHATALDSPVQLTATGTLNFANDAVNSQDGCKGATITLHLSSN